MKIEAKDVKYNLTLLELDSLTPELKMAKLLFYLIGDRIYLYYENMLKTRMLEVIGIMMDLHEEKELGFYTAREINEGRYVDMDARRVKALLQDYMKNRKRFPRFVEVTTPFEDDGVSYPVGTVGYLYTVFDHDMVMYEFVPKLTEENEAVYDGCIAIFYFDNFFEDLLTRLQVAIVFKLLEHDYGQTVIHNKRGQSASVQLNRISANRKAWRQQNDNELPRWFFDFVQINREMLDANYDRLNIKMKQLYRKLETDWGFQDA